VNDHTHSDRQPGPAWTSGCTGSATCDCAECYTDGTGKFSKQGPAEQEFFRGSE